MELERLTRKLEGLVKASKQGYKVRNLYEIMRQEDIWLQAYANIYSNKGALTKGIDDNTLDGMSKRRISNLGFFNTVKYGGEDNLTLFSRQTPPVSGKNAEKHLCSSEIRYG